MNRAEFALTPGDYWRIFMRRKYQFFVPFLMVLGLAIALAYLLPPRYRSEATLLIERQAIPTDLVATTVTGYVQERIEQITQRILTYDNLLEIGKKHELYASQMRSAPREAADLIEADFEVETVEVDATDPDRGGARQATVAFTLAFTANTPEKAKAVTQELADRYLSEHENQRNRQAAEVSSFLSEEADRLEIEIREMEVQLADFKQDNQNNLPELMDVNMRLYEKTETDIERTEDGLRGLQDEYDSLAAELSVTKPYEDVIDETGTKIMSASERLSVLTAQYLQATSRYSAKHPDVIRLSREIRILADQAGHRRPCRRAHEAAHQPAGAAAPGASAVRQQSS